jgi:hypothetical protein
MQKSVSLSRAFPFIGAIAAAQLAACGGPVKPKPTPTTEGQCIADSDCDDKDPCTKDLCLYPEHGGPRRICHAVESPGACGSGGGGQGGMGAGGGGGHAGAGGGPGTCGDVNPGAPTITNVSVGGECKGSITSIEGTNLGGTDACVEISGVKITPSSGSNTMISFTIPDDVPPGDRPITVSHRGGSTSSELITITDEHVPTTTSAMPPSAPNGASVTIVGDHLQGAMVSLVNPSIGAFPAMVTGTNDTSVTFTVPAGAPPGTYSLVVSVANCGQAQLDGFEVVP